MSVREIETWKVPEEAAQATERARPVSGRALTSRPKRTGPEVGRLRTAVDDEIVLDGSRRVLATGSGPLAGDRAAPACRSGQDFVRAGELAVADDVRVARHRAAAAPRIESKLA